MLRVSSWNAPSGSTRRNFYFRSGPIWRLTATGAVSRFEDFSAAVYILGTDGNFYWAGTADTGVPGVIARRTLSGALTVLHQFTGGADGGGPNALAQASDGNFYGTTMIGGAFGAGTVFRMTPTGDLTTLSSFTVNPQARSLLTATDGNMYGTTEGGGIFRLTTDGVLTVLHTGGIDGVPAGPLMQAGDGQLYGTTPPGTFTPGTVYRMTLDGAVAIVHAFTYGPEGFGPYGPLTQGTDGDFYGVTFAGGRFDMGTVFKMTPAGSLTVLHDFAGGVGAERPDGGLVQAVDGFFYGTTVGCCAPSPGTAFRISPSGNFTQLHTFTDPEGVHPSALVQASDGNFYGTARRGGRFNQGTIFRMTADGSVTVLYSFTGGVDGRGPSAGLMRATNGELYGTTYSGGAFLGGTLFKVTLEGGFSVVHAFTSAEGRSPAAALMQASDGNIYGTLSCSLSVFRMTPSGVVTILRTFSGQGCAENSIGLTEGRDANFYVTVRGAGAFTTIFRMTRGGIATTVQQLAGVAYNQPLVSLVQGAAGYLYGAAANLSGALPGAIFRLGLIPATFTGDLRSRRAVFRPSTGTWFIQGQSPLPLGAAGDIPVPGDYNGDGQLDAAMFRPSTGVWSIIGIGVQRFGAAGDIPVPADYDGDGKTDIAVFRPSTAEWFIAGRPPVVFGMAGDIPVPGDYSRVGHAQLAVYRPRSFAYYVSGLEPLVFLMVGGEGSIPVPADYDGDGATEMAVYHPGSGFRVVRNALVPPRIGFSVRWGAPGDIPVPQDLDGDGIPELVVVRRATASWFSFNRITGATSAEVFGSVGDLPIFAPRADERRRRFQWRSSRRCRGLSARDW